MKQIWKYMIVALAGLSMLACNKEENIQKEETPSVEGYTYTIAVAGDTKSYLDDDHMTWESGDVIGWFTDKAGNSVIDLSTNPRSFQVSSTAAMAAGATIYAYAPYKAGDQSKTAAPLSIPTAQDGIISDAMPMVSLPIELENAMAATTDTPVGQASFLNLGSVIEYNVYTTNASYASEKVQSIKFESTSNIAGSFTVDLTAVVEDAIPAPTGLDQKTVTSTLATATTVGDSKDNGVKVYQVIAPGTVSGTITVTTDAAIYTYPVSSKEFSRAKIKTLNADLASTNATRVTIVEKRLTAHQWELVGVKELSGGNWVSRSTTTGNKLTFNTDYSLSFDCAANSGKTMDHTWVGDVIDPDAHGAVSSMVWCTYKTNGKNYIGVSSGFLLVFCQDNEDWGEYEIKEMTENELTVEVVAWGGSWEISFEAVDDTPLPSIACPYWHDFANGDWGISTTDTHGGDGYYLDWGMTNPDVLDGATWTLTDAGYFEWTGLTNWRKGIQLGTGGMTLSNFILSSSSFAGEITRVTLGYNSGITDGSSLSVSCSVGGSTFGSTVYHGDGDYEATFNGSASGEIEITLNSSVNGAVYLQYLYIEYDPSATPI